MPEGPAPATPGRFGRAGLPAVHAALQRQARRRGGYFQQTAGAYCITLNTEAGERAYPTIYHEYVHLLVGNALAEVPVWFNEGLAEFYETCEMYGERGATLGRVNEGHVYTVAVAIELLADDDTP